MDCYAIGLRIRKIRKAKGLSQEQIAEKVGISEIRFTQKKICSFNQLICDKFIHSFYLLQINLRLISLKICKKVRCFPKIKKALLIIYQKRFFR